MRRGDALDDATGDANGDDCLYEHRLCTVVEEGKQWRKAGEVRGVDVDGVIKMQKKRRMRGGRKRIEGILYRRPLHNPVR